MPTSESDPRVFFASERTLLAWLRTGLTIIALGFVVSRFGLFVQLLATQSQGTSPAMHSRLAAGLGIETRGRLVNLDYTRIDLIRERKSFLQISR